MQSALLKLEYPLPYVQFCNTPDIQSPQKALQGVLELQAFQDDMFSVLF